MVSGQPPVSKPSRLIDAQFTGLIDRAQTCGVVKVWSGTDGALFQTLHGHRGCVRLLAIAPNGTLLAPTLVSTVEST